MAIVAWIKSITRTAPASPGNYADVTRSPLHSLHLFGKSISLKLATALGIITAALTGASLYALSGSNGAISTQPPSQPVSNEQHSQATADNNGSGNAASSNASDNAGSSQSGTTSSSSTTTTTTSVNGQTSTNVTVNGQPVSVPKNGTVQHTIKNPDGSTTQLSVSSDSTGVTTNSYTSNSDVEMNGGN